MWIAFLNLFESGFRSSFSGLVFVAYFFFRFNFKSIQLNLTRWEKQTRTAELFKQLKILMCRIVRERDWNNKRASKTLRTYKMIYFVTFATVAWERDGKLSRKPIRNVKMEEANQIVNGKVTFWSWNEEENLRKAVTIGWHIFWLLFLCVCASIASI